MLCGAKPDSMADLIKLSSIPSFRANEVDYCYVTSEVKVGMD